MKHTQYHYLYFLETLSNQIQNGQLHQGDPLPPESAMAKALSLPKRELRGILQSLEMMGICSAPDSGTLSLSGEVSEGMQALLHVIFLLHEVSPFEVCEMRRAMELSAYPMAFSRRDQLDLDALKLLLDRIQWGNRLDSIRADEESHLWLITASGNRLMEYVMRAVHGVCSEQVNLILSDGAEGLHQKQAEVHGKLYKSFILEDAEMGLEAIRTHYDTIEQMLKDLGK